MYYFYSGMSITIRKSGIFLFCILFSMITNGQEHQKIVAKSGDGIYKILRKNNLDPSEYFNAFLELNKGKIGENYQLMVGKTYLLPIPVTDSTSQQGVYPIFGKKYEKVTFQDKKLAGAVFYIISGHGGPDPGALGKKDGHRLCEDEYAYDIGLRLAKNLIEHSATVYIVTRDPNDGIRDDEYLKCDKDEYCIGNLEIPLNQTKRLKQRVMEVNKLYEKYKGSYQRSVELHVDSRYSEQNVDIFFYYHANSKKGKELSNTLFKTIKAKYEANQPGRGYSGTVKARNLYMLNNTNPISTYIELGNINHTRDQKRLVVVDNRQAIANWLTLGLIKDYENSKK